MLVVLLAAMLSGMGGARVPAAQAASCQAPGERLRGLPSATPRAATSATEPSIIQVEGDEDATATITSLPDATLVAATPAQPSREPAETLASDLNAVSEALAACLTAGDAETVTKLAGERFLGQLFGSSVPLSREDYIAIASDLTPVPTRIVSLEQIEQTADDQATAMVTEVVGNQLMNAEWTFERVPGADRPAGGAGWRLAHERQLPVSAPSDAAPIDVAIDNHSFTLDTTTVKGPDVVLHGKNGDTDDHEMLVLRLANGLTTDDLLRATGPDLPEGITFIGELPIRTGGQGDLALVDLKPGSYTLVCLFPDPQGTPHLAEGMEAVFTVR